MQIAGNSCQVCGRSIILASEGKGCPACAAVVHLTCEPKDTCARCGEPYQLERMPAADPLRDALLPPALRPRSSGGPALVIGIGLALLALVVIIWLTINYQLGLSRGL